MYLKNKKKMTSKAKGGKTPLFLYHRMQKGCRWQVFLYQTSNTMTERSFIGIFFPASGICPFGK